MIVRNSIHEEDYASAYDALAGRPQPKKIEITSRWEMYEGEWEELEQAIYRLLQTYEDGKFSNLDVRVVDTVQESVNESYEEDFEKLAKALEKKKVPCKLVMSEFQGDINYDILCGFDYPDSVFFKADDAMKEAGVKANVSADIAGGRVLKSRYIAGGPKRYRRW